MTPLRLVLPEQANPESDPMDPSQLALLYVVQLRYLRQEPMPWEPRERARARSSGAFPLAFFGIRRG